MTNTGTSSFTWAPVLSLGAGAVLAEWPELGPLLVAPVPAVCSRPGSWAACVFASETLLLPLDCEVRLS